MALAVVVDGEEDLLMNACESRLCANHVTVMAPVLCHAYLRPNYVTQARGESQKRSKLIRSIPTWLITGASSFMYNFTP